MCRAGGYAKYGQVWPRSCLPLTFAVIYVLCRVTHDSTLNRKAPKPSPPSQPGNSPGLGTLKPGTLNPSPRQRLVSADFGNLSVPQAPIAEQVWSLNYCKGKPWLSGVGTLGHGQREEPKGIPHLQPETGSQVARWRAPLRGALRNSLVIYYRGL